VKQTTVCLTVLKKIKRAASAAATSKLVELSVFRLRLKPFRGARRQQNSLNIKAGIDSAAAPRSVGAVGFSSARDVPRQI
jgi:hypothetical protein